VSWPIRALGLLTFGLVTNLLSDVLPRLALVAVILVGAVVVGLFHLPRGAPAARVLPGGLLYLAIAGVALAVVTPDSWTGPLTVVSVLLVGCSALAVRHRAAAFTSLAGMSIFTVGVVILADAGHAATTAGTVLGYVMGAYATLFGLLYVFYRRSLFGTGGITTATLRTMPVAWSRAGALGILAVPAAIQLVRENHVPAGILVLAGGLSWLATTMVFVFSTTADTLAGATLTVSGACVTTLGLLAFYGQQFLPGAIALTAGVAMAGGGLSLLESCGVLDRLTALFKSPASPDA
jgi:hypothetical protein